MDPRQNTGLPLTCVQSTWRLIIMRRVSFQYVNICFKSESRPPRSLSAARNNLCVQFSYKSFFTAMNKKRDLACDRKLTYSQSNFKVVISIDDNKSNLSKSIGFYWFLRKVIKCLVKRFVELHPKVSSKCILDKH